MKVLTLLQQGLFPVVPMLMDEIETGQLSLIVSFNSVCNEAGRNMLGIQGAEVFLSALWCLVEIAEENKKLYKQIALLRQLHHTLLLPLSSYVTDLWEALMELKMKLTGTNVEGSICNMLDFLWKQIVNWQNYHWQD